MQHILDFPEDHTRIRAYLFLTPMSLEHSPDLGQFTPRFSRPQHLRHSASVVERGNGAKLSREKNGFHQTNTVKKLSAEQRMSLMELLHTVPSMAPVIAMMIDHAPDTGRTIRYPEGMDTIGRNQPCETTGVKAKHCTCEACINDFGDSDEKQNKFDDRLIDAQLPLVMAEELHGLLIQIQSQLQELARRIEEETPTEDEARAENEPDVQAVGG